MKKILMSLRDPSGRLKKAWVMSKWTLLFVLLGMFNVHGAAYSQNEQQVTLSMKNAYLKDVIWALIMVVILCGKNLRKKRLDRTTQLPTEL